MSWAPLETKVRLACLGTGNLRRHLKRWVDKLTSHATEYAKKKKEKKKCIKKMSIFWLAYHVYSCIIHSWPILPSCVPRNHSHIPNSAFFFIIIIFFYSSYTFILYMFGLQVLIMGLWRITCYTRSLIFTIYW